MMDEEKKPREQNQQERLAGEPPAKRPARYGLYDKAKLNIPLKVMDIIIYAIVALIILAAVIGIIIGD